MIAPGFVLNRVTLGTDVSSCVYLVNCLLFTHMIICYEPTSIYIPLHFSYFQPLQ